MSTLSADVLSEFCAHAVSVTPGVLSEFCVHVVSVTPDVLSEFCVHAVSVTGPSGAAGPARVTPLRTTLAPEPSVQLAVTLAPGPLRQLDWVDDLHQLCHELPGTSVEARSVVWPRLCGLPYCTAWCGGCLLSCQSSCAVGWWFMSFCREACARVFITHQTCGWF